VYDLLEGKVEPPSVYTSDVPRELDSVVLCGLARNRSQRFASARQMLLALERAVPVATQRVVADWVESVAGAELGARAKTLQQIEQDAVELENEARQAVALSEPRSDEEPAHDIVVDVGDGRLGVPPSRWRAIAAATVVAALAATVLVTGRLDGPTAHAQMRRLQRGTGPAARVSAEPAKSAETGVDPPPSPRRRVRSAAPKRKAHLYKRE
jgi:hypothetical protein